MWAWEVAFPFFTKACRSGGESLKAKVGVVFQELGLWSTWTLWLKICPLKDRNRLCSSFSLLWSLHIFLLSSLCLS